MSVKPAGDSRDVLLKLSVAELQIIDDTALLRECLAFVNESRDQCCLEIAWSGEGHNSDCYRASLITKLKERLNG